MMKLRFGTHAIAAVTFATAVSSMGYQLGFESGDNPRRDRLHDVIRSTAGNGQWEQLGGPQQLDGGVFILTTDGCEYFELDASGRRIESTRSGKSEAGSDAFSDVPADGDPFCQ